MPLVWVYLKPVVVPVYPKIIAAMDLEGWLRGQTPLPPAPPPCFFQTCTRLFDFKASTFKLKRVQKNKVA